MTSFLLNLFLLSLVVGMGGSFSKVSCQTEDIAKAKKLWEQVIAAKGGRERLLEVRNLVVSSSTEYVRPVREFKGERFEDLFVLPDKWWSWGNELGITIWNYDFSRQVGREARGSSGAVRTYQPARLAASPEVPSKTKEAVRFRFIQRSFNQNLLIYLMETKWLRPTIVRTWPAKIGNKRVDVIETSFANQKFEFYIDRTTHLPAQVIIRTRIELTGTSVDGTEYVDAFSLGDYIEVAGIKFPQTVRRERNNKTTYQVNVDYDKTIFERPPSLDMRPDTWRPQK